MDPLFFLVEAGGPVVACLLVISVATTAVIVLKMFQLWQIREGSARHIDSALAALEKNDFARAKLSMGKPDTPRGRLLHEGIQLLTSPLFARETLRNELERIALLDLNRQTKSSN